MLSWSPRADIEDEERQYFKANVFPEVSLPQPIRLRVLTSLPWTAKTLRFTHTHTQKKKRKGRLTKCYQLRFPRLRNGTGQMPPPPKKKNPDHFIRLAWRRCIITHVTLHAPAAALVAVTVLCGSTAELRPGDCKDYTL